MESIDAKKDNLSDLKRGKDEVNTICFFKYIINNFKI